ncbi:MAG: transcription-repair coupling factor, partial [Pseudomonadota bacterium]
MGSQSSKATLPAGRLLAGPHAIASGVPEGLDALLLGSLAEQAKAPVLHVARDGQRAATLEDALTFFAPDVRVLSLPAWDCVPYDRVGPNAEIVAVRIATLSELAARDAGDDAPLIVLTTVNAIVQRVPPRDFIETSSLHLRAGNVLNMGKLVERLEVAG